MQKDNKNQKLIFNILLLELIIPTNIKKLKL